MKFNLLLVVIVSYLTHDALSSKSLNTVHSYNTANLNKKRVYKKATISNKFTRLNLIEKFSTPEQFGAKGDGITDDTKAIIVALNSNVPIINFKKTKAYYRVSNIIVVTNISRKKLILNRAIILNSDLTKATFLFQNAKNIEIRGGEFGYVTKPTANGGNSQHVFQFDKCQNVLVDNIHIRNSPEMGIAISNSNNVTVQNSLIEHTFRDGTYAHYSANVKYIHNKYKNIKDDAMSFHDYGLNSEKEQLNKYGYTQAKNLIAKNNSVENAYQGFGSIAADGIQIINNSFTNTVIAGIAVFNSKDLYPNSTVVAKNIKIVNNIINEACRTVTINDSSYKNNGQASSGRAAIFVASLGSNNQLNNGETKQLSNIIVSNNKVYNSGANGFFSKDVNSLKFTDNEFYDCSGAVPSQSLSGDVIEIANVTNLFANNNTIIDRRTKTLHRHGYVLNNVSGSAGNWKIKGVLTSEKFIISKSRLVPFRNKL